MDKRKLAGILGILVCSVMIAYALSPQITSFDVKRTFPDQVQVSWEIESDQGLDHLEVYQDSELLHREQLTGTHQISLYQTKDDGLQHTFKLIVYDLVNLSSEASKTYGGDSKAPVVNSPSKIYSNSKVLMFTTDEPASCKAGFSETSLVATEAILQQNHSIELPFAEGLNRVFVKCSDAQDNLMQGFFQIEFVYDVTPPSAVSTLKYESIDDKARITWAAATDNNGIDHYNIYNTIKSIASTQQLFWEVSTDDSLFSVTAVDLAGNEGPKTDYNLKRDQLLASDAGTTATETNPAPPKESKPLSKTAKWAWITFGILVALFVLFKIYEYQNDKHGLRRYLKHRRKMREFDVHRKL